MLGGEHGGEAGGGGEPLEREGGAPEEVGAVAEGLGDEEEAERAEADRPREEDVAEEADGEDRRGRAGAPGGGSTQATVRQ